MAGLVSLARRCPSLSATTRTSLPLLLPPREDKRDGEFRLRHAAAAIADLPEGPDKDELRVDYARTVLSRVPR